MTDPQSTPRAKSFALFSYGFRPFFLLAAIYAVFSPGGWTIAYFFGLPFPGATAPTLWHAHEMLFGFATAAVVGFLLTAVPSWTGTPAPAGRLLIGLSALWLAGRVVLWFTDDLPQPIVAAVDLLMIPALLLVVTPPVLASGKTRNLPVLGLAGLLFVGNLLYHAEFLGWSGDTARFGVRLAAYALVLLVTMIAGRIIPAFTSNALRATDPEIAVRTNPLVERTAIILAAAALLADLLATPAVVTGTLAVGAAATLALRMRFWQSRRTLGTPILWVLHLAHAWLPVAFALLAAAKLAGWPLEDAALHAFTAGAIATAIIAVMSRAGLGHTGRPLKAPPAIIASYLCVSSAAVFRVAGAVVPDFLIPAFLAASGLWALAFALFAGVYGPILAAPRPDGKAG